MSQVKTVRSLNTLTKMVMAFDSWTEFEQKMSDGYCPSLYPHPGRSKAQKEWNRAVVELADRLEAMGYKVFRGTNSR